MGVTGFGGYTVLVAMIQKEFVERKKILDAQVIYDGIMIASVLPGPLAVNIVTYIGYSLRGWIGAVVSLVCILLPACTLMVLTAFFVGAISDLSKFYIVLNFLMPVVAAIILSVAFTMFRKHVTNSWQIALTIMTLLCLTFTSLSLMVGILMGGMLGFLLGEKKLIKIVDSNKNDTTKHLLLGLSLSLVMVVGLFMIVSQPLQNLLGEFSKVSLTLFGGGYVMIKALHDLVVMDLNWISSNEFNQAIAFGQLTPGPILVSATYIGFKVAGLWGALIATIGIFLPASLLMLLAAHGFKKLPDNIWVNAVLMGIRPVIVSFIVFSALIILKPVGFNDQTVVLTILSFVLIEYVKINFLWLMLISGLISLFFL